MCRRQPSGIILSADALRKRGKQIRIEELLWVLVLIALTMSIQAVDTVVWVAEGQTRRGWEVDRLGSTRVVKIN